MVSKRLSTSPSKKLKIKKETLKDLGARRKVKAGGLAPGTLANCRGVFSIGHCAGGGGTTGQGI